jgi:hypothetical protein
MIIKWEIEDGYAGGSRPHTTEIPDNILAECDTEFDKEMLIEGYVQADFDHRISWHIIE